MGKFVPKEKMSKKAKKQAAAEKRLTWAFSPVTRRIDSKKTYNRKRISRTDYDGKGDSFVLSYKNVTDRKNAISHIGSECMHSSR